MVKADRWHVDDAQVVEKTGRPLARWSAVLDGLGAAGRQSNAVMVALQNDHGVPRYWARTLTTRYLKERGQA